MGGEDNGLWIRPVPLYQTSKSIGLHFVEGPEVEGPELVRRFRLALIPLGDVVLALDGGVVIVLVLLLALRHLGRFEGDRLVVELAEQM